MRARRSVTATIALAGLVAAGMVATPTAALAAPPGEEWEPPVDAASNEIPAANAPDEDWAPRTGGRFGAPVSEEGPDEGSVQLFAAPQDVTADAPGVGELPWFSFQDFALSTDTLAQVNIANGNLLITANDLEVAAPGYGLRADRFYNGLTEDEGKLGGGWKSSIAEFDVGLKIEDEHIDFYAPNGYVARFDRDGETYGQPDGLNATLTREEDSGDDAFVLEYNRSGEKLTFSHTGYLTRTVDRNDVGSSYSYRGSQVEKVVHDNGRAFSIIKDWANDGPIDGIEDSAGRATIFQSDRDDRLTGVSAADGELTSYSYDAAGRIATIELEGAVGGHSATFSYDNQHRVTEVTESRIDVTAETEGEVITKFAYRDGETVMTDPNGETSTFEIDEQGRVLSATDALDRTRSQEWTPNSDIASTTDALGSGDQLNTTTYSYDEDANRTDAQLPTGAAAAAAFQIGAGCDAPDTGNAYQVKCSTDDAGNTKQYEYDQAGNVTKQTDTSDGGAEEFERTYQGSDDAECGGFDGQLCSTTDGNGATTSYSYTDDGDLHRVSPPGPLGDTVYSHDSLGRVTNVTDGNRHTTRYLYDVRDRVISTIFHNGQRVTTSYYPNGLERRIQDSAGGVKEFEYDAQGRITSETGPNQVDELTYRYDRAGNLIRFSDTFGETAYRYDAANQLTSVTEPGGSCPDSGEPGASSGCIQFEYDKNGAETARLFPNGATVETERDRAGRAIRTVATDTRGATVFDAGYDYAAPDTDEDRAKIQTRTSHDEEGIEAGASTAYEYDSLGRLTSAVETLEGDETASWKYGYDRAGNRTEQTRAGDTGSDAGTIDYEYNDANQLVSQTGDLGDWSYDAAGNQTARGSDERTSSYGDRAQATKIGTTDIDTFAAGNDQRTTAGAVETSFTTLGLTRYKGERGSSVRFSRTPDGIALSYERNKPHYYVQDSLGSVVGMFDDRGNWEGGYSYSPYGETRAIADGDPTETNPLRYISGLLDDSGLYKLGARYYDPAQGRFTQMDPSGQEASPYSYAAGDPVNNADPSGLNTVSKAIDMLSGYMAGKSITVAAIFGDEKDVATVATSQIVGGLAAFACTAGITAGTAGAGTAIAAPLCLGGGVLLGELVTGRWF